MQSEKSNKELNASSSLFHNWLLDRLKISPPSDVDMLTVTV